ncbi:MAG: hypothetical protein HFJ86_00260 [Oscillospiraceae bacterium]|nr:hypothetical protein [Oscillospiraceae bacterium]
MKFTIFMGYLVSDFGWVGGLFDWRQRRPWAGVWWRQRRSWGRAACGLGGGLGFDMGRRPGDVSLIVMSDQDAVLDLPPFEKVGRKL